MAIPECVELSLAIVLGKQQFNLLLSLDSNGS
jgi:hypothetical protein